ncbi:phage tail assembly chaperone [Pseudomonas sp. PSB1]|uniref:phage tail assembly chaperone n=1 Tax=Pseudomonas sp. PSB1 TaxID=477819 RepID=UPI001CB6F84C|nr:phage tail assembly chaperone [Pseudomonas sp. PSB1]MBD0703088.1 hypothetical protein [Pseudomonas sp. PSB1]
MVGKAMWALVRDGVVIETTDLDPEGRFHPDMEWRSCAPGVLPGWLYENGLFTERVADLSERIAAERQWRDGQLFARQWLRDRHRDEQEISKPTTLSNEQFMELLTYLQALREWPQMDVFPDPLGRPSAPDWIDLYNQ